ncbi:hypothetical protein JQK87_26225 [Streptomyces sp. G44]|uniref:hypothetical protein n=1 Tax=Streptomyces sp. G44 TaxID=2807632 RepID=UPI001961B072|nr:hypothetical protein [Streptomyces sp. G44]MBM7171836.1 hypothetical protein [Streptomyces sp. G44]
MNNVLCGLAANPALPPELTDRLIAVADPEIAADLTGRGDLTRAQAVALASRVAESAVALAYEGRLTAADIDPATRPDAALALLDQGAGDPAWARRFATDPVAERREKLAACPGLPADVVETLARDPRARVVAELAYGVPAPMAARLARHPHAEVRRAVAANEATPPAVLAALVTGEGLPPARRCLVCDGEETPFTHDPYCPRTDCDLPPGAACGGSHESAVHGIHLAALGNPATPAEAVAGFADHPSMLLRLTLAVRTGLPREVYRRLADDPLPGVRADLARNPALDEPLLRALAEDRDPDVRRSLAHHPRVPLDVLVGVAGTTRIGAALLPRVAAASPAEVEELARSPHPAARTLVAARRDLPAGTRDALAADPDAKVVNAVIGHPGLPEALLRAAVERYGGQVAAKVAAHPDASPALLEDLALRQPPVRKALREIARHRRATGRALLACLPDARARPLAAGHPALPPQALVELLGDGGGEADGEVVRAAAANPALPRAVMAALVP